MKSVSQLPTAHILRPAGCGLCACPGHPSHTHARSHLKKCTVHCSVGYSPPSPASYTVTRRLRPRALPQKLAQLTTRRKRNELLKARPCELIIRTGGVLAAAAAPSAPARCHRDSLSAEHLRPGSAVATAPPPSDDSSSSPTASNVPPATPAAPPSWWAPLCHSCMALACLRSSHTPSWTRSSKETDSSGHPRASRCSPPTR